VSKRTQGSGSSKRKKAIAKADALRAVIDKTKPITQFFNVPEGFTAEVAADLECRCQKFVKNRTWTWSHFSLSAAGVWVVFIYGIFKIKHRPS